MTGRIRGLTMGAVLLSAAVSGAVMSTPAMADDKRIGIIVFDGVLSSDVTAPIEVFGIASKKSWFSDYETLVINVGESELITTEEGITLKVDAHVKDQPKVDVLLMPSSYDMDSLLENQALIQYIQKTSKTADWMASNCSGAFVLAEAGVLDGKKATTWAGGESDLESAYPKVDVQFDTNYVIDGNVITSNGSVVSYQAALALLEQMSSERRAKEVEEALQMQRVWKVM
ncbi:DJ-1/PfpI family protein [Litoribrevibacter albus]|uniref:Transcriptional regulator n=1 Tax=Litoribrevibacter albus TaxID=1473156 RepID=A0AA37SFW9_9GAMM|nr:DJ-1/PfpI family protein [Litoribrevibacter albus]GLQ33561.1 transcriptional regulator [Litoribrevibacter albus]